MTKIPEKEFENFIDVADALSDKITEANDKEALVLAMAKNGAKVNIIWAGTPPATADILLHAVHENPGFSKAFLLAATYLADENFYPEPTVKTPSDPFKIN